MVCVINFSISTKLAVLSAVILIIIKRFTGNTSNAVAEAPRLLLPD